MSRLLTIALHDGGNVTIRSDVPEDGTFDGLGGLLRLDVDEVGADAAADAVLVPPGAMPEGRHALRNTPLTEAAYMSDWSRILVAGWKRIPRRPDSYRNSVRQTLLICAGLNAVLRGVDAVLAHCAVLEADRGAVLILGESGMGKTTAFSRWRACGGKGYSDDMALLDFTGNDGIHVRRMPTWSACREGRGEWDYPAGEELPLAGVFALGRSDSGRDEIVGVTAAQFFAQCYRSMFYWILFFSKSLPEDLKERLTTCIRRWTETLAEMFPQRALLTALEGDLKRLIEDAL